MRRLAAILLLLLVTGCVRHVPVEARPPMEPPGTYLENRHDGTPGLPPGRWWRAFDDQTLDHLMDELFAQNLELTQALARLEQVESAAGIADSARLPQASVVGEAARSNQPGLTGDFTGDSRQLSLAAGFELDLWGKLASRSRAAHLDLAASRQEVQALYLGLSARLADFYYLAAEQRAQLALTDRSIASFADTLSRVERRYRLGLVPAVDMYQARQSLSAARAARQLFAARLAEAEHAIAVLLGRYPQRDFGSLDRLPAAPVQFEAGIPAALLSRRPDLVAALRRVEASDARVAAAIADRFPSIGLSGSAGNLRQEVTAGLIQGEFWSLLGNLALPVVDGGRRKAEVQRSEAVLREAVAAYQQQVLSAFQDVEDALANNYATAQRVDHLSETVHATDATLRLSTERYLSGLTDYLPVLTAQRADFDARSRLLAAQRQLLADRISLARALGGTWMQEQLAVRLQAEKDNLR